MTTSSSESDSEYDGRPSDLEVSRRQDALFTDTRPMMYDVPRRLNPRSPIHPPIGEITLESQFEMSVRMFLARKPFGFRAVSPEDLALFCQALTHDSAGDGRPVASYERLEFLGDAVLELLACEEAFSHPEMDEGAMTAVKQDWVTNRNISDRVLAHGMDLDSVMRVGGGHLDQSGRPSIVENMRADCFEALLAAIYLTRGMDEARRVAREVIQPDADGGDP